MINKPMDLSMGLFRRRISSQEQVQEQGQNGTVLVVRTVSSHQQEQQDNQQIPCVEVVGQKPSQETGNTGIGTG